MTKDRRKNVMHITICEYRKNRTEDFSTGQHTEHLYKKSRVLFILNTE